MTITQLWEDCTIGFICPVCGNDCIADSQNAPGECECGTEYYLSVKLVVTPAGKGKDAQTEL